MKHKEEIQQFINAIANDKYTLADEIFPKVMESVTKNVINNSKPDVLNKLNAEAEQIAISAINFNDTSKDTKEKSTNA